MTGNRMWLIIFSTFLLAAGCSSTETSRAFIPVNPSVLEKRAESGKPIAFEMDSFSASTLEDLWARARREQVSSAHRLKKTIIEWSSSSLENYMSLVLGGGQVNDYDPLGLTGVGAEVNSASRLLLPSRYMEHIHGSRDKPWLRELDSLLVKYGIPVLGKVASKLNGRTPIPLPLHGGYIIPLTIPHNSENYLQVTNSERRVRLDIGEEPSPGLRIQESTDPVILSGSFLSNLINSTGSNPISFTMSIAFAFGQIDAYTSVDGHTSLRNHIMLVGEALALCHKEALFSGFSDRIKGFSGLPGEATLQELSQAVDRQRNRIAENFNGLSSQYALCSLELSRIMIEDHVHAGGVERSSFPSKLFLYVPVEFILEGDSGRPHLGVEIGRRSPRSYRYDFSHLLTSNFDHILTGGGRANSGTNAWFLYEGNEPIQDLAVALMMLARVKRAMIHNSNEGS